MRGLPEIALLQFSLILGIEVGTVEFPAQVGTAHTRAVGRGYCLILFGCNIEGFGIWIQGTVFGSGGVRWRKESQAAPKQYW